MTPCEFFESPLIELYFYDELEGAERQRVELHVGCCADCRQRLEDLQAISRVLASIPRVETPPAGDWSGFMTRLEQACGPATPLDRTSPSIVPRRSRHVAWRPVLAIAAMVVLVTIAVLVSARFRSSAPTVAPPEVVTAVNPPSSAAEKIAPTASPQRSLMQLSEQHFDRSKLVILGLVTRDPQQTTAADWEYERELAGSLLSDTRLYRQAAQQRGMEDLARVMGDLETVLLETSLSEHVDRDALERVQRLIRKRDLVVKMQMVGSTGI